MIDVRTFMLVLAIGNIGFAMLMAAYARSAVDAPALRVWTCAKLVQGLAHLFGWLRPDFPHLGIIVAGNTALILGTAIEVAAYCTLFGLRGWKRWLYPGAVLALLGVHAARFSGASGNQLMALMSAILVLFTGALAAILLRPGAGHSLLQRVIGVNDLVFCAVMGMRAYTGLTQADMSLFTSNGVQTLTYLTGFLLMIVNGFGFLLLCKEGDDRKMSLLATIDSLTGLVNRRAFFERTESARRLAARMCSPIALMMIDIDHFKRLNDKFGHATGDEALRVFAATAQKALRDQDIMGRLGGEEFALVLPGTDLDGALQAAERLRDAVACAVLPTGEQQHRMTISIGVVLIDPSEHIKSALARADHALYAAKTNGRDRVEVGETRLRLASCNSW